MTEEIKYYIISRASITQDIVDRSCERDPYQYTANLANTQVVVPFHAGNLPVSLFLNDSTSYTKTEIDAYIADPTNGFVATDQEEYADDKNYALDGVSKSVMGDLDLGGSSALTISMWVNADLVSVRNDYLFGLYEDNDHRFTLRRYTNGYWYLYNYASTTLTSQFTCESPSAANGLNHVLVKFDAGEATKVDKLQLWINGVRQTLIASAQDVPTALPSFTDINFVIGCDREGAGNYFIGDVQEFAVWGSEAISSTDIATVYNSGTPCDIRTLEPSNYYWFGDSATDTASVVTDLMGNADLTTNNITAGDINDN